MFKNRKFMFIQKNFSTNVGKGFRAIFSRKYGEADGAWNLGLNVVGLLVSVNMCKSTQKLNMLKLDLLLHSCKNSNRFNLNASFKFSVVSFMMLVSCVFVCYI